MKLHTYRTAFVLAAVITAIAASPQMVSADVVSDCKSGIPARAIVGCSIIVEGGATATMDLATAYAYRANASEAVGKHSDALDDLNKAIRLNPNQAGLYSNRGNVYLALGSDDKALADYTEAIKYDPNFAGAYFNRGNVYSRRGKLGSALRDLTAAVHLSPAYAPAHYNRGIVYLRLGLQPDALADFRETLKLNPHHQGALDALRKLGFSQAGR